MRVTSLKKEWVKVGLFINSKKHKKYNPKIKI